MEQRGLVFEENRVRKGEMGRGVAPAPKTELPGVLAALEQPPNNFPAPPQTFPSAGEAPPPPRAPAEHPPGAAGAAAGKGRAERGREGGRELRAVRSPAGLLPGGSEPLPAPGTVRAGDPRRGGRGVPGTPLRNGVGGSGEKGVPSLPLGLGELAESLAEVVEGAVGLRLGRDALRPGGAGPDVRAGGRQHGLAFVQPPPQLLDLLVLLPQAPLQLLDPLLFQQQQLGEVPFQLGHFGGAGPVPLSWSGSRAGAGAGERLRPPRLRAAAPASPRQRRAGRGASENRPENSGQQGKRRRGKKDKKRGKSSCATLRGWDPGNSNNYHVIAG